MKISEGTLKILKNFSSINQSIYIKAGNILATQAVSKDIVAEAVIDEEFPVSFCLYDLPEFINTLKLFKSPVLDFAEASNNYMYICEEDNSKFRVRYTFSKPELIIYPERKPVFKDAPDVTFIFDVKMLESVSKASNIMQLSELIVVPGDEPDKVSLEVTNVKDKSSNKFSVSIDADYPADVKFRLIFTMGNIKMIPNTYAVSVYKNRVSSFVSEGIDYYIALSRESRFEC